MCAGLLESLGGASRDALNVTYSPRLRERSNAELKIYAMEPLLAGDVVLDHGDLGTVLGKLLGLEGLALLELGDAAIELLVGLLIRFCVSTSFVACLLFVSFAHFVGTLFGTRSTPMNPKPLN